MLLILIESVTYDSCYKHKISYVSINHIYIEDGII